MTNHPTIEPLHEALADLPPLKLREFRVHQVRRRCHAELKRRTAVRPPRTFRATDLMIAGAVAAYVVSAMTEALQLLGAWSG
jgi:hypothetical protein